jgi:pilus assembly protein FimV
MMDQIIEAATDPLYLGAGGGLIALGGLAFWMARRRRGGAEPDEPEPRKAAPVLGRTTAAAAGPDTTRTMPAAAITAATAAPAAAAAMDEVDPLAEAEVYIAYGRDAQAEEILKEALATNPKREDAQLKLLEIHSARKDKDAFNRLASDLHSQTGGAGANWLAAAAMGYALDPNNALYEAGRHAAPAAPAEAGTASNVDFEVGGDAAGGATDITLDSGAVAAITHGTTAVLDATKLRSMAAEAQKQAESQAALVPDFSIDIPAAGEADTIVTQTDIALDAPAPTQDGHIIDFQIELPKVDAPETQAPAPAQAPIADGRLDFKLDIPDLDLGDKTHAAQTMGGRGEKDGHWYDMQTKFDLAKAYQEMGDKDGAREILQEVIKEGDSEQQAQASKLLESLA